MSDLIYLYAPVGERIGTFCPDTGRAQIGNLLLSVERICHIRVVKHGPLYSVYHFDCCDREWSESNTDAGATELPGTVCPYCGAVVVA